MKWNGTQTVAAAALVCSFVAPAVRAEPSMAVLDLARVFEEYEMTRDLEEMFDQKRRAAAEEAEQRRASMEQMRRALAAFDPVSADFARREEDLTRAQVDFEVWSGLTEKRLKACGRASAGGSPDSVILAYASSPIGFRADPCT